MRPVSNEEYKKMQDVSWQWAYDLLKAQHDDARGYVSSYEQRPIIDLKQMLESSRAIYKNEPAFYTKFKKGPYCQITYDEFYHDVNAMGTALIAHGLKDKKIAVIGETNYTWCVAYMGVLCGTGIVVPLDKELPYSNLKTIVCDAEISAVVADKARLKHFKQMLEEGDTPLEAVISQAGADDENPYFNRVFIDAELGMENFIFSGLAISNLSTQKENPHPAEVSVPGYKALEKDGILYQWEMIKEGKSLIDGGDRSFIDARIDPTEMSILIYTSGTMGMAKGIMLSHRNIVADIMAAPAFIHKEEHEVFFSMLPIHHTFECSCNFMIPIYRGCTIAHCEGLKYIVKNMQEVRPTFFLAVPAVMEALHRALWKNIKKQDKEQVVQNTLMISKLTRKLHIDFREVLFRQIRAALGGRLRMIIVGGAAINPQILDDFQDFGINAIQGYGLSETSPISALNPEYKPKSYSCGVALPGFDARIDKPGPDGIGEICVKGDHVMLGYYKDPDATAEAIKDGWFYTGDIGYIDDEGYIVITGRKKNVIITKNGKNVFPEELEYMLLLHDEIMECMVFEDESDTKDDTVIMAAVYPNWEVIKEVLGDKASDDAEVEKYLWNIINDINKENPGYKMIKRMLLRHKEFEKNSSRKIKRFVEDNKKAN